MSLQLSFSVFPFQPLPVAIVGAPLFTNALLPLSVMHTCVTTSSLSVQVTPIVILSTCFYPVCECIFCTDIRHLFSPERSPGLLLYMIYVHHIDPYPLQVHYIQPLATLSPRSSPHETSSTPYDGVQRTPQPQDGRVAWYHPLVQPALLRHEIQSSDAFVRSKSWASPTQFSGQV